MFKVCSPGIGHQRSELGVPDMGNDEKQHSDAAQTLKPIKQMGKIMIIRLCLGFECDHRPVNRMKDQGNVNDQCQNPKCQWAVIKRVDYLIVNLRTLVQIKLNVKVVNQEQSDRDDPSEAMKPTINKMCVHQTPRGWKLTGR